MTILPRRTIDEIKVRYELEPGLKDIYVEGKFDQDVLSNRLCGSTHADYIIYDIDSVDIPCTILTSHGLSDGNKQRVIALARELEQLSDECRYRCLVDRDLDHWFGNLETTKRLIWTDYCSIELYFFSSELLRELLVVVAKSKITNWDEFMDSLISTLRHLYSLRLADRDLGWSLSWLSVDRCLSRDGCKIVLSFAEYVRRLLMKNGKVAYKVQFDNRTATWHDKLSGDPRNYIRGHDLLDFLVWTINEFSGIKELSSLVSIQRILVALAPRMPGLLTIIE